MVFRDINIHCHGCRLSVMMLERSYRLSSSRGNHVPVPSQAEVQASTQGAQV